MLNSQIIALREGGTELLQAPLRLEVDQKPDAAADSWWQDLCYERVQRALEGDLVAAELFVCLLGDELVQRRDPEALARVLARIRDHCWGARVSLVTPRLIADPLVPGRGTLEKWLGKAIDGRALDLLQVIYDPYQPESLAPQALRDAVANRASKRLGVLRGLSPAVRPWRCVLTKDDWDLTEENWAVEELLRPLVQQPDAPDQGADLVIVVDNPDPGEQKRMVKETLKRYPRRRSIVATLGTYPTRALSVFCQRNSLPDPLHLGGELELWYFLLHLNHSLPPAGGKKRGDVRPVALDEAFTFPPTAVEPVVLFTSSFDLDKANRYHCLAAAKDVGSLLARTPLELCYHVEPAINRQRLNQILDRMPGVTVWIHMGHGKANHGLWQAGHSEPSPPEMWLRSFAPQAPRLGLALFLTCHSADIARAFAQAGAGVAIGFGGPVHTDQARELAFDVLQAVVSDGLGRPAILRGFYKGVSRLESVEYSRYEPRAFYPAIR